MGRNPKKKEYLATFHSNGFSQSLSAKELKKAAREARRDLQPWKN